MTTIIGVDPAFSKPFAVCIYRPNSKTIETQLIGKNPKEGEGRYDYLFLFLEWAEKWSGQQELVFIVENGNLQNVSFDTKGNAGVASRKSRSAGAAQAVAQLAVDGLRRMGFQVEKLSPRNKGKKDNKRSTNFRIKGRNLTELGKLRADKNEDTRDAAKIAIVGGSNFLLNQKYKPKSLV